MMSSMSRSRSYPMEHVASSIPVQRNPVKTVQKWDKPVLHCMALSTGLQSAMYASVSVWNMLMQTTGGPVDPKNYRPSVAVQPGRVPDQR